MADSQPVREDVSALESQAMGWIQAGRDDEAAKFWQRILAIEPLNIRALTALGQRAFRTGDLAAALKAFQQVVDSDGSNHQQWVNLALVCRALHDEPGEEAAIERALALEPTELISLILKGNVLERSGRMHEAVGIYSAVAAVAPPLERLHPDLRAAVAHARRFHAMYDTACASFMDDYLHPYFDDLAGVNLGRFRDSLDIVVGRKRRFDSHSTQYHVPGLALTEFFERDAFPWMGELEAATDAIRDEFLDILKAEEGFTPYISYPQGVPVNQFAELNNSPRWSAFHLYKSGELVRENAAKCPNTMSVLANTPLPDQPMRTPAAMFSLLKPKTRIPPHNGVTNCRVVTHLPLIVPADCGFRVGNETREWVPGRAWVFDDTIEHEAWNMSDKLRVVLIFDVWHPGLTPEERTMITAMTAGMNAFAATAVKLEA